MPYKDKTRDRRWHKDAMRIKRAKLKLYSKQILHTNSGVVTPSTLNSVTPNVDADGNVIYDE